MFGTLVSSRPRRERGEALSSTIGSIAIHSLIIAGLVYATANVSATPAPDDLTRVISLAPPPVPIEPPPPMQELPPPPVVEPDGESTSAPAAALRPVRAAL